MGTRGVIGREYKDGFKGVHHHWDSYPTALGETLFNLRNGHFAGNTSEMLKFLIDEHPAGWSTINDSDFSQPPGFCENGFRTDGPHCYCHGGRSRPAEEYTHENCDPVFIEWAYSFTWDGKSMFVHCSNYKKFFNVAKIDLDGLEPNWQEIENIAEKLED